MKRISQFLDDNLLFILSVFLMVFIPLYPKIPLMELLPGYIVRLRLEDIFVGIVFVVWLIWLARGKVKFDFPVRYLILGFIGVGLISIVWNMFVTGWIPMSQVHIQKSLLHLARHIEYFFLGFLLFSSCKSVKQLKIVVGAIFFTVAAISIYAIGQKYFYWPVFSTMNREFSKGMVLYLTEGARVPSTFGGHYDFAAYLVIVLPITLIVILSLKKRWLKLGAIVIHFLGVWGLIVSASRTSFGAYLVAVAVGIIIFSWGRPLALVKKENQKIANKKKEGKELYWLKSLGKMAGLGGGYLVVILTLILFFGDDLAAKLVEPFSSYPAVMTQYNNFIRWRDQDGKIRSFIASFNPPEDGIAISYDDQNINLAAYEELKEQGSGDQLVKIDDEFIDIVATDASQVTGEKGYELSEMALKYGLSLAIRLEALWPMAIEGWQRSPLVGSGFGTLNKLEADHYTEADSTDNNYLRLLGETGLLGLIIYMSVIILAIATAVRSWRQENEINVRVFNLGFLVAMIGLLINVVFIDVFISSKVAFTMWAMIGIVFASRNRFRSATTNGKSREGRTIGIDSLIKLPARNKIKDDDLKMSVEVKRELKEKNKLMSEPIMTAKKEKKKNK